MKPMTAMTQTIYEEREGTYRYVRITTDKYGRRELATNSAGEGLFSRTVYTSGPTDWKQIRGTLSFSARSLKEFQAKTRIRQREYPPVCMGKRGGR